MTANTNPIWALTPVMAMADSGTAGQVVGFTANSSLDGSSSASNMWQLYQAGANGTYVSNILFKPVGSPVATVARIFISNVTGAFTLGTTNTSRNTALIAERALPAVTASATSEFSNFSLPINLAVPASYRVLISFGTSTGGSAATGYHVTMWGGDY